MASCLTEHLQNIGHPASEGHMQEVPAQVQMFEHLLQGRKNCMEIGFNAGHSAEIMLRANPDIRVTSFDLGMHDYLSFGKAYLDQMYPFRHRLILGDSRDTVPEFTRTNPGTKFDLIFVDGGHSYDCAKADLSNVRALSTADTLIIMDDVVFTLDGGRDYTVGPTFVWKQFLQQKRIEEVGRSEYGPGRGMAWGKFTGL